MRWSIERLIPLSFSLALLALIGIGMTSYRSTSGLITTAQWVAHTHEVIARLEDFLSTLKDAETGQRGYLITGREDYLEPYEVAKASIAQKLNLLRQLTADNPRQQERLATLDRIAQERLSIIQETIELRRRAGLEAAAQVVLTGQGKGAMDQARRVVADMEEEENRLLQERQRASDAASWSAQVIINFGSIFAVAIVGFATLTVGREFAKRKRAEAELQQANAALERRVEERTREVWAQREQLHVTLASIGDAVMATDTEARVTFLNPVAEALTGWKASEAVGSPLKDIFHIVNEQTRREVENPITRVLREGAVVGLANHTVLVARDGTERPIDDSGAPIRDDAGRLIGAVIVFRDITERRQAEQERARLAAIVASSDDAIISKSLDGVITSWNPGAERLFGYTAEEVIGQLIELVIPPERREEERQIIDRLRRGERVEHFETVRVGKDGQRIDLSLSVSPIRDEAGQIVGAAKVARDITERKRLEREREQLFAREQAARDAAETASRMKDEFLANVSHELRTPLNAMLGWARLLRAGSLDGEKSRQAVETIERSAKVQAQLIEDLLDVSRIISGKLRLDVRPVMVTPVVESALQSVKPMAEAKGVELQTTLDAGAGPISGDSSRLQQVVWNLLTNAIKFTPRAGRVEVRVARIDSQVEIVVSDTGQGISREFLPHVFDRFRQADATTTRQHGGLGLGLAIVRHLVELHGGAVTADSPGEGQGATFAVRLPLMAHPRRDPEGRGQSRAESPYAFDCPPDLEDARVLLIDDEPSARELLRTVLEHCQAEVREATSVEQGLREAQQWRPSIIVCDIGMPGEDGYIFIQKLREREKDSEKWTPAVALTAYARAEDRVRALAAGYQLHVAKPVEPLEFTLLISGLLGRKNGSG